jgi:KaiC/GvpD/RAD55 family RecA-like ATPase
MKPEEPEFDREAHEPRAGTNGAPATEEYPPWLDDDQVEGVPSSTYKAARPVTPSEIARVWAADGPLVRVPTGLPTLDEACRGGLPIPWRVVMIGAPSAGKTALLMVLAQRLATDGGLCVGVLGVDEDPDDLTVRLAQMAGFTIAQCEGRDPAVLQRMAGALASVRVRFYDATHTIEAAADDVSAWATAEGRRPGLLVDSLQTVRGVDSIGATSPRELVDVNLVALRAKAVQHRMLVAATSEANRASYRDDDAAETTNDLAAGKESGGIEFFAQTLIMVRTPKGHADHVHVRVPKNRRGARAGFEFFLRLDRDRHTLSECVDPKADPEQATRTEAKVRAVNRVQVDGDAQVLAGVVRNQQGTGERALRAALRLAGYRWGVERLDAAKARLSQPAGFKGQRLTNRGDSKGARYHLEALGNGGAP